MSKLDRIGRTVSQKIRIRGIQYFERGAVRIVFADPDFVSAKVSGSQIYDVDLERDGNAVIFSCDCPYFEDHREVCKHVWATLLQLEKLGHLQEWNASFPEELVATDSDEEMDDDYLDDFDLEELETLEVPGPTKALGSGGNRGAASQPDSWQLLLNKIKRSEFTEEKSPSWPPDREIIYVLEYSRYAYGASLHIRIDVRDRRKNGDWKKPKPLTLPQNMIPELPDPADRDILSRLIGVNRDKWYYRPYETSYRFQPLRQDLLTILPLISRTGRFFFHTPESGEWAPGPMG